MGNHPVNDDRGDSVAWIIVETAKNGTSLTGIRAFALKKRTSKILVFLIVPYGIKRFFIDITQSMPSGIRCLKTARDNVAINLYSCAVEDT